MDLNKDFRKRIRRLTVFGDVKALSEKTGYTSSYISQVIKNGKGSAKAVKAIVEFYSKELPKREKELNELYKKQLA